MPPRKTDASKAATGDEGASAPAPPKKEDGINIEDLNLPKSIVTRLAKGVLPPNTQIQGNAMLALSKSATVFVNYVATHANEYAQGANRKTIAPADVFKALEDLEFDFKPRLEAELTKFNEVQADKRNTYRKKVAADKAPKGGSAVEAGERSGGAGGDGDAEPAPKKPRRDAESGADGGDDQGEMLDEDTTGEIGDEEQDEEPDVDDIEEEEEGADEAGETPEDALEESEERENDDEALDNGEDSD